MLLIYLIVNYLYRKYGVPLHNFFENWTRGISHLKRERFTMFVFLLPGLKALRGAFSLSVIPSHLDIKCSILGLHRPIVTKIHVRVAHTSVTSCAPWDGVRSKSRTLSFFYFIGLCCCLGLPVSQTHLVLY